jgi:D-alanine-D-alanine ligase
MRIGIFFGGQSREREISYLGGRTAYQHLDKSLFVPVPIFVDSFGNFILLKEEFLYKNGIRDFYTQKNTDSYQLYAESFEWTPNTLATLINELGQQITPQEFLKHFDFALIALHGQPGEDGSLQGLFEWYDVPYSGCGLLSSAIGIDKIIQNKLMAQVTGQQKRMTVLTYQQWQQTPKQQIFDQIIAAIGFPFVVKAPHQGSSIGVAIVKEKDLKSFIKGVEQCFFVMEVKKETWINLDKTQRHNYLQNIADLDKGIAFPLYVEETPNLILQHPTDLAHYLDNIFHKKTTLEKVTLVSKNCEDEVLFEEFIEGQEFSCGVIQDENGKPIALPPTEIISTTTFDFDSKYKTGGSKKIIPIQTSNENIANIQQAVAKVFEALQFNVCARIDGFLTADSKVILHDPNTIPGMSPASLIFKQTAEIGLDITQTLSYFIRASLQERIKTGKNTVVYRRLLALLDNELAEQQKTNATQPIRVEFTELDNTFQAAKEVYFKATQSGNHHIILLCVVTENGQKNTYPIRFPNLLKDTFEEMLESAKQPRHVMLIETEQAAKALVSRY